MEQFIGSFLNSLMSEAGVVAVLLMAALLYQTNELKLVRRENAKLHEKVLQLATNSVSTMGQLQATLDKFIQKGVGN